MTTRLPWTVLNTRYETAAELLGLLVMVSTRTIKPELYQVSRYYGVPNVRAVHGTDHIMQNAIISISTQYDSIVFLDLRALILVVLQAQV